MATDAGGPARRKYLVIADALREAIAAGELGPGARLPSTRELQDRHRVSLMTVRQALDQLVAEGLIEARPGSGVYVRQFRRIRREAVSRLSASQWGAGRPIWEADSAGRVLVVDQVAVTVEEPPPGAVVLDLNEGDLVVHRSRRFTLDGKPVMIADSYLPEALVRGTAITQPDTGPGGTYARLADLGHSPVRFTEEVVARMPSPVEVERLQLAGVTPVIVITRVARTAEGRAVELNEMILDAGAYVLSYDFPA